MADPDDNSSGAVSTRTVFLDGGDERLELKKYRLDVLEGPNEQRSTTFERRRVTIGSDPDNHCVIDDPAVSRVHAQIEVEDQGYLLTDRDSKNGTFVNGLRANEVYIDDGTTFRIGKTTLRFSTTDEDVEVQLSGREKFGDLIGRSRAMREVFSLLERVAPSDATVLVKGESGTGKELVARSLHEHNPDRSDGPFNVFDCSAVAENLMESALFGHVEGAFTGATGEREGAFQAADGGTLFIDELGKLSPDLQPKLLRVLENQEVKPVGSNDTTQVDVRVVAATNQNLHQKMQEGTFREDLYYRLAVVNLELPPLRERPEDIPLLVEHFLEESNEKTPGEEVDVSYSTMEKLKRQPWPGNVRELRNFVERAVLLAQGDSLETKFLDVEVSVDPEPDAAEEGAGSMAEMAIREGLPFKDAKNRLVEEFERTYWRTLLQKTEGNVSEAARRADVHRKSVEYILKKHGISREEIG
jgi:DNA-binding NtrC family response regulator